MVSPIDGGLQVAQHGIHGPECWMLCRRPAADSAHYNGGVLGTAGGDAPEAPQAVGHDLGGRRQGLLGPSFNSFLGERDAGETRYNRFAILGGLHSRDWQLDVRLDATGQSLSLLSLNDGVAQAVPEPETYALMLAGLSLVGFAARRRA